MKGTQENITMQLQHTWLYINGYKPVTTQLQIYKMSRKKNVRNKTQNNHRDAKENLSLYNTQNNYKKNEQKEMQEPHTDRTWLKRGPKDQNNTKTQIRQYNYKEVQQACENKQSHKTTKFESEQPRWHRLRLQRDKK